MGTLGVRSGFFHLLLRQQDLRQLQVAPPGVRVELQPQFQIFSGFLQLALLLVQGGQGKMPWGEAVVDLKSFAQSLLAFFPFLLIDIGGPQ